jgi:spore coat polysaccharide biosynthesis protein SpsF (cytidylyltransferase family)
MSFDIPVFITARMGSTRLPGKHLLPLNGKPCIEQMITRVKNAHLPEYFVLCTTTLPEDDVFIEIAERLNIKLFRGHPTDILKRWLDAADQYKVRYFISAEADDIFCDPELIDRMVRILRVMNPDYISYVGIPIGITPTGIGVRALRKVCESKTETNTEGQERFFTKRGDFKVFKLEIVDPELKHPTARMTLDYYQDYGFFQTVYSCLGNDRYFTLREIIALLNTHPDIVRTNQYRQEHYERRYQELYGN